MGSATVDAPSRTIHTTALQAKNAQAVSRRLEDAGPVGSIEIMIGMPGGTSVPLPKDLREIVIGALNAVAEGATVTIGHLPAELTTTAAARLLGVSRPTLMKDVASGALPAHKVGSHTRLRSEDVLELRAVRRAAQRKAALELLALGDELDEFN